ncbi:hypothetical protein VMCG_08223 [Cytospora schulzeri]|uniref:Transcription factor domain-containing protein n=1 Tax=Cytospora schulzeri TaxID=448051 RepID=A0A423VT33_9PEZI|nr:hypothetical protein VMCG_08223 [Valsa malicola]
MSSLQRHWFQFTSNTLILLDDPARESFWNKGQALIPFVKGQSYVGFATRSVASLHINYLRTTSTSGSPTTALARGSDGSSGSSISKPVDSAPGRFISPPSSISSSNTESPDIIEAYKNLVSATSTFRSMVPCVNDKNWVACVGFSIAVTVFQFDTARRAAPHDFKTIVVDTLRALRNAATIHTQISPQIRSRIAGQTDALESRQKRADIMVQAVTGSPLDEALDSIGGLIRSIMLRQAQAHGYEDNNIDPQWFTGLEGPSPARLSEDLGSILQAAVALEKWIMKIVGRPRRWQDIMFWPSSVSDHFFSLIVARDSAALAVIVHWFAIVDRAPRRWYLDGWALRAAAVVMIHIGPEWEDLLVWPRRHFGFEREI